MRHLDFDLVLVLWIRHLDLIMTLSRGCATWTLTLSLSCGCDLDFDLVRVLWMRNLGVLGRKRSRRVPEGHLELGQLRH